MRRTGGSLPLRSLPQVLVWRYGGAWGVNTLLVQPCRPSFRVVTVKDKQKADAGGAKQLLLDGLE